MFITLFIPGVIGTSSWLIAFFVRYPKLAEFSAKNWVETAILLGFAIITFGMVIDDLGSHFESWVLDCMANRRDPLFKQEWKQYLLIVYSSNSEPVSRSYLRALLQHLKFEINAGVGLLCGAVGLCLVPGVSFCWSLGVLAVAFGAFWEAFQTHEVMRNTRKDFLNGELRYVGAPHENR